MINLSLAAVFFIPQIWSTVLGSQPELRLVNVVFRHGDRTPAETETYPNDPFANCTYYPLGRGQLTNGGKQREYRLGQVLKSRYGDFLGPIYDPTVLIARSSDMDRTKMSLQLVLSALYPPERIQKWNSQLKWQPIPTVYSSLLNDKLLLPQLSCPLYGTEYRRVKSTAEVQEKISAFSDLMKSVGKLTGQEINDTLPLYALYHTFAAQKAADLALPKWVDEFWPDGELLDAANLEYEISSYNDYLKRIYGGTLLREITDNAVSYVKGTLQKGRKLYLYSGHEVNVASLQLTLGVYEPHVPAYSSAVILEFWQREAEYFVKVLYHTGIRSEVVVQQIPGCSVLCPFNKFLELLKPVTATDADLQCTKS